MKSNTKGSHWPLTLLGGGVSILNMLLPLILVRILSLEEMGRYKVYFLYLALMPWFCLTAGIGNGLSHWAGHTEKRMQATRASWGILLCVSCLFLLVSWPLGGFMQSALGWNLLDIRLLLLGVFVTMLSGFFDDASIAWGNIMRGAFFNSGFDLSRSVAMVITAFIYRSVEAVFVAHIVVFSIKLIVGATWGYVLGFQRPSFQLSTWRHVAKYAFPVSLAAAVSVGSGYSDQLVLSRMLAPDQFAIYSFGCLLVPPLIIFEQSVGRVLIPSMSLAFAEGAPLQARTLFRSAIAELAWLHLPAALGLFIFAEAIVELLYTSRYLDSAAFLRIYALNYLVNHFPYDCVDRSRGRGGAILLRLSIFAVITPFLVYIGLKYHGPAGGLCAAVACNALMRWGSAFLIRFYEGWTIKSFIPWKEWGGFVIAATCATVIAYLIRLITGPGIPWLMVGGLGFTLIYLAATSSQTRKKITARLVRT